MRLIKHIIFSNLNNNEKLMINSLNGLMDRIDEETYHTITNWQRRNKIIVKNDSEADLYKSLKTRGYLTKSYNEEIVAKNKILETLKNRQDAINKVKNHITFVMTYECNFKCTYCFEKDVDINKQNSWRMTLELVDAALNLMGNDLEYISLFGGEPLLPVNIPIIKYILSNAPDKIYSITTNGYYLEEFLELLLSVKIRNINITLDGEKDDHDKRRFLANNEPTFKKIIAGVKKCLDNNIPLTIRMNIDATNLESGLRLRDHLVKQYQNKVELLSFEIAPMIGTPDHTKNEMLCSMFKADLKYTPDERADRNKILSNTTPLISAIVTKKPLKPIYSFCYAHDSGFVVDPCGMIYPCLRAVGIKELAIGSYFPVIEFKENSIRSRNIGTIPECSKCIYSLMCGGGCPVALQDYCDVFKPECHTIKDEIHNLIPAFIQEEDSSLIHIE